MDLFQQRGLILFAASVSALEILRYTLSHINDHKQVVHESASTDGLLGLDSDSVVSVSAPGKVLVAGGYLILEKENLGITVAGTSRFYASVRLGRRKYSSKNLTIVVYSPQFHENYTYQYNPVEGKVEIVAAEASNVFVAKCLQIVFAFLSEHFGHDNFVGIIQKIQNEGALEIKLRANNDFYSQTEYLKRKGLPVTAASLRKLPPFMACPIVDGKVNVAKTGLGSSATLTTSLVGALLKWFGAVSLQSDRAGKTADELRIVHNLAQLAHCNAQGKIGSGFDVAAAVYGTQVYQRFSAEPFAAFLDDNSTNLAPKAVFDAVTDIRRELWDHVVQPFHLPAGIDLLLGDVCGGSNSPSMARAVLQWRKDDAAAANVLWRDLACTNRRLLSALQRLHHLEQQQSDANAWLTLLQGVTKVQWTAQTVQSAHLRAEVGDELVEALWEVRSAVVEGRRLMREMGNAAGVEIEPAAQTLLCDATMDVPGVLAAAVPGAGGNDAIYALVLSADAQAQVERLWADWSVSGASADCPVVCPLLLRAGDNDGGVGAQRQGVRLEEELAW